METLLRITLLLLTTATFSTSALYGQECLNFAQFPSEVIVPPTDGTALQVSTCVYAQEYTHFGEISSGATYQFTMTGGNYITLRSGTFDGAVVAEGISPLTYPTTDALDLFAHYTLNAACATATDCEVTTVQVFLDCTPPTVSFSLDLDCEEFLFYVDVDVTSMGDSEELLITNDQGAPDVTATGPGVYQTGPYFEGLPVIVTVAHEENDLCTVTSPSLVNSPCPVVSCGPDNYNYCYGNNENTLFTYQGDADLALGLSFTAGTIAPFGDLITIYDGFDDTAPVLFTGTNGGDLTGVVAISTNPDHALAMKVTSDGSTSCQQGGIGFIPWEWTVACLDCAAPVASFELVQDCDNFQYFIDVDITSLGSDDEIEITNTAGAPELSVTEPGVVQVGPITSGVPVVVTLVNDANSLCNLVSQEFINPLCGTPISCGAPPLEEDYCYGNFDFSEWAYSSDGGGSLKLTFLQGTIESGGFDRLYIYDGVDATAPILFQHVQGDPTSNLGPPGSGILQPTAPYYDVDVTATGDNIFMRMESDGSVSCQTSTNYDPWEWVVVCLDCVVPNVSVEIVDDCENNQFFIDLNVEDTGDGDSVDIVWILNDGDAETEEGVVPGILQLGPFVINDVVNVTVLHESSEACTVDLGDLTDTGTCPTLIPCGTDFNETHCYNNNEDRSWYYQGIGDFPLAILFNAGTIATFGDFITIYDGLDETAPVLYTGFNGGNLAGLFIVSNNDDNALTLRSQSDGFTSCLVGGTNYVEWDWTVACLDCVPPDVTFSIIQDCENFQYFVEVDITDLGTDEELVVTNTGGAPEVSVTAPTTLELGPFVSGTEVEITVVNDNGLCNIESDVLVNPLCPAPIDCPAPPLEEDYCYGPNDFSEWAYELTGGGTLKLTFIRGTIESGGFDRLYIYDGVDATAPILFQHIQGDPGSNLGPPGSAILNTFTNFHSVDVTATSGNLFMRMESDGSVQCTTTASYDPWEWEVYCIDCSTPLVSYNLVPTCEERTYVAEVIVTDMGGTADLEISELVQGSQQTISEAGVYTFGPYAFNDTLLFDVQNLDYGPCLAVSDTLVLSNLDCVIETCGENFELCYPNNADLWYTFKAAENVPITITFLQGQMLANDRIILYNGYDEEALVLYQGNNGGNLTGFALNSQNIDRVLTLRVQSDATGSCADEQASPEMRWFMQCGAVGIDETDGGDFSMYPNPTNDLLYIDLQGLPAGSVHLRVLDVSGRVVIETAAGVQGGALNTLDVGQLQAGNYLMQLVTESWVKTRQVQVLR